MSSETDTPSRQSSSEIKTAGVIAPLRADQTAALLPRIARIVSDVSNALPGCRCTLQVFDRPDELHTVAASEVPGGVLARSVFPIGAGIAGWVAKTGTSMLVPDVGREPRYLSLNRDASGTLLCVAVTDEPVCYGTLTAWSPTLDPLGGAHALTVLRLAAQSVALTIASHCRAEALRSLAQAAADCDDPARAIDDVIPLVQQIIPHRACILVLGDTEATTVQTVGRNEPSHDRLGEWALRAYDDWRMSDDPRAAVSGSANGYAAYTVPLYAGGTFPGLACYFRSEPFSPSEQDTLEECTHIVASALNSARLLQRTREERERFEHVFARMQEGLLLLDLTGEVALYANAAFHALTGVPRQSGQFPMPEIALAARYTADQVSVEVSGPSGLRRWSVVPKADRDTTIHVIESPILIGDVPYRLRVFRPQLSANRLDRTRSEFMRVVSHELRSPLASVYGFLNLLTQEKAGPLTATQRDFLRAIHVNVRQLWRLIEDICDLVQSDENQAVLQLEEVDPTEVILAAVTSTMPLLQSRDIRVDVEIEAPLPRVEIDPGRFHQILNNLLTNAMKFSEPGAKIGIRTYLADGVIHVAVRDHGPGVAPEDIERIFERFVKGRNTATRDASGLGLGLAVVRQLVTLHGGRVWIENTPGGGSTFVFTLPSLPPSARSQA